MSTEYAFGKIVTNGLVLSLDAADVNSYTTASVTWIDLSGNRYNTTMSGSVAYSGSFPNSFQYLSGSNNYFSGSSDLTGSIVNGVTISSWIKIIIQQLEVLFLVNTIIQEYQDMILKQVLQHHYGQIH
jgi:hypothetical protein